MAAAFWTALAASSAELRQRSVAECKRHSALLTARQDPTLPCGGETDVLVTWPQLLDDRCAEHIGGLGRAAWLRVQQLGRVSNGGEEGWLVLDPWPGLGATVDPGSVALDPLR